MQDLLISNKGDILIEKNPSLGKVELQFNIGTHPSFLLSMQTDNERALQIVDRRFVASFVIDEKKSVHFKEVNERESLKQQVAIRLKTEKNSTAIEGLGNKVYRLKHQSVFDETVLRGIEKAIKESISDLIYEPEVIVKRAQGNNKQYLNNVEAYIYNKDHLLFTLNI